MRCAEVRSTCDQVRSGRRGVEEVDAVGGMLYDEQHE